MHPQHRGRRSAGPAVRGWARLRQAIRRAGLGWRRYEDRLRDDPGRRERSAMIVVGVAAVLVLLAMVGLFVVASQSHPAPARAVPTTSRSPTPTRPPTTAPATTPPAPTTTTASPTPDAPAGGTLRALHSGRCLAVRGDSREAGAPLVQRSCDGDPVQGFHLVPVDGPARTYQLVDGLTGRCVDVSGGSTADGGVVIQWDCGTQANQRFTLRDVPGGAGSVQLVALHSGKCLAVAGGSTADDAEVQQSTCEPAAIEATARNQSWLLAG
jgi:Ricin-type beta-trefoil lectin domain-like